MRNETYKVAISFRIFDEDPHYSIVYSLLESIANEFQGKRDTTTSMYLFVCNDIPACDALLGKIKNSYNRVLWSEQQDYDDEIHTFVVTPEGKFLVGCLEVKREEIDIAEWSFTDYTDYVNQL